MTTDSFVRRYTDDAGGISFDPDGDYVYFEDYAALQAENERLKAELENKTRCADAANDFLRECIDENERLHKDAERYKCLRNCLIENWYVGPETSVDEGGGVHGYHNHWGDDLDAFIDTTIEKGKL